MSIRRRILNVERELRAENCKTLIVMANRCDDPATRARIERAKARGWRIRMIRFSVMGEEYGTDPVLSHRPTAPSDRACPRASS